ncbi:unnamed protein product [Cuscuta campestris]|uniref:Uncharacterized protein n=1 Tax=Cuscuta campestris TaxID=132261 RepID=A0A484MCD9_9ASTE|nr:unnamed protein product [Cuscuta campestris]
MSGLGLVGFDPFLTDHRFDFDCEISIVKEGDAGSVGIGNALIESQTLHVMLEVDLLNTLKICQVFCSKNR